MKKILVLGGTRYFGGELVKCFIEKGHDITVATRGNSDDGFGDSFPQLKDYIYELINFYGLSILYR